MMVSAVTKSTIVHYGSISRLWKERSRLAFTVRAKIPVVPSAWRTLDGALVTPDEFDSALRTLTALLVRGMALMLL